MFYAWKTVPRGNSCMLDGLENVEFDTFLLRGKPFNGTFPEDALFRMSNNHKRATGLQDNLCNYNTVQVCSKRMVEFFRDHRLKNVEYLPVTIRNHKGKVASKEYCIVHPIVLQDALALEASKPTYSHLIKTEIDDVERLVLDTSRIDPEVALFRVKAFLWPVFIEQGLADLMTKEGFVGPYFQRLEDWSG